MTIVLDAMLPPCATVPEVYRDDEPLTPSSSSELGARLAMAHRSCAGCPMLVDCLYRAVVEVDVSGFVACTTEQDRAFIRRRLGIEVVQQSLTPYGAARVGGSPVSHDVVMTARQAYPKDTCLQLAERLGCSTSTIKRHLRRARQETVDAPAPDAVPARRVPSVDEVLDAFDGLESSKFA